MTTPLTGREPRLSRSHSQRGERKLSLRSLATMLDRLPPHAISLEAAEAALHSEAFFTRYGAATLLAKRGDRDARLLFERALDTGSVPTRASVARRLGRFAWQSIEPLVSKARGDADPRVREALVYALADMADLSAYQTLAAMLETESDAVRLAAAVALRESMDPAAVPALAQALKAADPEVRSETLESLGANATPQAVPITRAALEDPDPNVCYSAALSLLELIGESALPELAGRALNAPPGFREALLRGIFHATNYLGIVLAEDESAPSILEALRAAIHDPNPSARMAAVWPLAWMRTPEADTLLQAAFREETDETVRAHIVRVAVSLMMNDLGEAILHEALQSPQDAVREAGELIVLDRAGRAAVRYDSSDTAQHGLFTAHLDESEVPPE